MNGNGQNNTPGGAYVPQYDPTHRGTGYVNLSSFLGANNASNLGNNLGQGVMGTVNNTTNNIQNAQNQFTDQYGQAQNKINGLQQGAQNTLNGVQNTDPNATYNASPLTNDQVNSWNQFNNATYNGPQSLNNYGNLLNQQTQSQQAAQMLGSTGGQQQLLNSYVNNPNYTNTDQSLDSLFLGAKPIQQNLQQVRSKALNQLAGNDVNAIAGSDAMQAQNAANNLQQQQQALTGQAQSMVSGLSTDLTNKLNSMQSASTVAQNLDNSFMSNNYSSLDPQTQAVIKAAQQYGWANPNSFVNYQGPQNLTLSGVANNQQANQLAGLQQLLANQSGIALTGPVGGAQAAQTSYGDIVGAAQKNLANEMGMSGTDFANQYAYNNSTNAPKYEPLSDTTPFDRLNFLGNNTLQSVLSNGVPTSVDQMLSQSGYNIGNTNNLITQATQQALQMLQQKYGLTPPQVGGPSNQPLLPTGSSPFMHIG